MPNIKSAEKRLRTSLKRRSLNLMRKSRIKTTEKKFLRLLDAKDLVGAEAMLKEVFSALDKAIKTNTISRNKASRDKSRLSKRLTVAKLAA